MKLEEIKTGEVFTIENTPSYPKLKIDGGYVDMRDEIVNKSGNCNERDCQIMTIDELKTQFEATDEEINNWIKEKSDKYIIIQC